MKNFLKITGCAVALFLPTILTGCTERRTDSAPTPDGDTVTVEITGLGDDAPTESEK